MKRNNIQNTDPEDLDMLIPDEAFWDLDYNYYFTDAGIYRAHRKEAMKPGLKYYNCKEARDIYEKK